MLTLQKLLDDPLFRGARRLAATDSAGARQVSWFSVIEWPAEDFVQPGDVVMTTAVGCDDERFVELVTQVVARQPAGVMFALSEESLVGGAPAGAVAVADDAGVPLVELPWSVPFAEVARTVVEQLSADGSGVAAPPVGALGGDFVTALLGDGGVAAIADVAEVHVGRPVVVLGADLRVDGAGPRALAELGRDLERYSGELEALPSEDLVAVKQALERTRKPPERLGLPAGVIVPAESRWRTVGYVLAAGNGQPEAEGAAIQQAAQAVAVEQLRARAVAEADVRAHGDLLWAIARGDVADPADIARRAALVGYGRSTRYVVAVGLPSTGSAASNDAVTLDALTLPRLRRHGVRASRSEDGVLAVAPADADVSLGRLLDDAAGARWGIADGDASIVELRDAYLRAHDTAVAALAVGISGRVAQERALGPYLLLTSLKDDPSARRAVEGLLGGLIEYDRATSRDLMRSLAVYLAVNGNTSAAARELHLNRHSLLYRLQKIEALTGRDLQRHDDRFLLDLALRLWRMLGAEPGPGPDG